MHLLHLLLHLLHLLLRNLLLLLHLLLCNLHLVEGLLHLSQHCSNVHRREIRDQCQFLARGGKSIGEIVEVGMSHVFCGSRGVVEAR